MAKRIPPSPKPRQMREMASDEKQREQDQWQHQHHALTHEDGDAETSGAQPAESDRAEQVQSHEARQSRERDAQAAHAHQQRDPKWLGASEPKRAGTKRESKGNGDVPAAAGTDGRAKHSTSGSGGHGYAPEIAHGEESGYGPADAAPGAHPRFGRQSGYGPHDDYAGTGRDAAGFADAGGAVKSPSEARRVDWPEGTVGAPRTEKRSSARSDAAVHDDIRKTLSDAIDLDISHVEVTVTSGLVLLTGYVPERWMQHVVQTEVAKVEGVLGVDNRLHERRVKAMSRPGESQEGHKI
ncbi:transport-associated protein [Pandoraea captiosa]|uniref:Transport-associated protein n=1 Tax=Pandoraea captiosa TaxID=2508302 RepID=A0A5E4ZLU7_9BURK|nr:BON domain-containing protein [Pandoraea captiosa]VVE62371.1 transport-associated protein [Pandoraea captiosa]